MSQTLHAKIKRHSYIGVISKRREFPRFGFQERYEFVDSNEAIVVGLQQKVEREATLHRQVVVERRRFEHKLPIVFAQIDTHQVAMRDLLVVEPPVDRRVAVRADDEEERRRTARRQLKPGIATRLPSIEIARRTQQTSNQPIMSTVPLHVAVVISIDNSTVANFAVIGVDWHI